MIRGQVDRRLSHTNFATADRGMPLLKSSSSTKIPSHGYSCKPVTHTIIDPVFSQYLSVLPTIILVRKIRRELMRTRNLLRSLPVARRSENISPVRAFYRATGKHYIINRLHKQFQSNRAIISSLVIGVKLSMSRPLAASPPRTC
jgi:hypothetical protein